MPPDRSGRAAPGDRVAARSATGGEGGDLVGRLDGRRRGERPGEGALLTQVATGGATAGEGGVQAGHGVSFSQCVAVVSRESDRADADTGSGCRGLVTVRTSASGVTVEPGSSRRSRPRTGWLSGCTVAVKVRTPRRAARSRRPASS